MSEFEDGDGIHSRIIANSGRMDAPAEVKSKPLLAVAIRGEDWHNVIFSVRCAKQEILRNLLPSTADKQSRHNVPVIHVFTHIHTVGLVRRFQLLSAHGLRLQVFIVGGELQSGLRVFQFTKT